MWYSFVNQDNVLSLLDQGEIVIFTYIVQIKNIQKCERKLKMPKTLISGNTFFFIFNAHYIIIKWLGVL